MDETDKLEKQQRERRDFLSCLGSALACGAAAVGRKHRFAAGGRGRRGRGRNPSAAQPGDPGI